MPALVHDSAALSGIYLRPEELAGIQRRADELCANGLALAGAARSLSPVA